LAQQRQLLPIPSLEEALTIPAMLELQARRFSDYPALLAPSRKPLSYSRLYQHIEQTVLKLNQLGIGRGDRVMLIVPDGPELATAILAAGSGTTLLPVSSTLLAEDYKYLLTKSGASVLLIQTGLASQARTVAEANNIRVLELIPDFDAEAGIATITTTFGVSDLSISKPQFAQPEDILQFVTTSGTTGRPKLVARTHDTWCISTPIRCRRAEMTSSDRFLCMLPMQYTTGVSALLQMLWVGGSTVCTPGFDATRFFPWLDEFRPTWVHGSVNNYKALLAQAPFHQEALSRARSSLRDIRISFMTMPPKFEHDLERLFQVPILQGYGTTETLGITTVLPPPHLQKAGSVGTPNGNVDLATMDGEGNLLPAGEVGEIVVQGPTVFKGYEGDPEATAQAFINGWYRTGDLGYLDEDGYLFLTGRLKEIINRGGFKISPLEVEEALLTHPSVKEAVAFGIPDRHLGEEIGAAVILQAQHHLTERELRTYSVARLTEERAPRRILLLDELPHTPAGKLQRIGLAARLGLTDASGLSSPGMDIAPRTVPEQQLAALWASVLGRPVESISINAAFRDLGGDSLGATRLVFAIRQQLNIPLTILDLFDAPTIERQAEIVGSLQRNGAPTGRSVSLIPIQPNGSRPPLFCFHALNGGVFIYQNLLPYLPADQPLYGLQAVGLDGLEAPLERIEDMADYHLKQIRSVQMNGPYYLCGYSMGGRLALEVARRVHDEYNAEAYVFIIEDNLHRNQSLVRTGAGSKFLGRWRQRLRTLLFVIFHLSARYKRAYMRQKLQDTAVRLKMRPARQSTRVPGTFGTPMADLPSAIAHVTRAAQTATNLYRLRRYDGPVTFLRTSDGPLDVNLLRALKEVNGGQFEIIDVPGSHNTIMRDPNITVVGQLLDAWLNRVQHTKQ